MTNKTAMQQIKELRNTIESSYGATPSNYGPFERGKISQIVMSFPEVDVSVTELRPVSIFGKAREPVDAGFYPRVKTEDLLDISGWFHSTASGGGKYIIELFEPDNRQFIDGYTVKIDGPSKKAPPIVRQEEMHRADMSLKTTQIAQQLIASGIEPATAYEAARKMAQDNPQAHLLFSGMGGMGGNGGMGGVGGNGDRMNDRTDDRMRRDMFPPKEEDGMEKLFRMMLMKDLVGGGKKHEDDSETRAMRDQVKRLEDQLAEERHQAELRELRSQMENIAKSFEHKPAEAPKTDWPVLASTMVTALGGMFSSMNSQQQAQATQQVSLLKEVLGGQNSGKSDMVNAVMSNMMGMMQMQVQQQQARMQEPMQQMQMMGEMARMTGGLLQAMVEMQKQLSGDDPAWLKLALDMMGELPNVIRSVAEPVKMRTIAVDPNQQRNGGTHESKDEYLVRAEYERSLQGQADKALAELEEKRLAEATRTSVTPPPPPPAAPLTEPAAPLVVAPPAAGGTPDNPMRGDEPVAGDESGEEPSDEVKLERARALVQALGFEVLVPLLEFDGWVEFFSSMAEESLDPEEFGYRFVEFVLATQEAGSPLDPALEELALNSKLWTKPLEKNLKWPKQAARDFTLGIDRFLKEHKVSRKK